MSLSKNINPCLELVQPRKTCPFITERLLMGRKESNQTKQNTGKTAISVYQSSNYAVFENMLLVSCCHCLSFPVLVFSSLICSICHARLKLNVVSYQIFYFWRSMKEVIWILFLSNTMDIMDSADIFLHTTDVVRAQ